MWRHDVRCAKRLLRTDDTFGSERPGQYMQNTEMVYVSNGQVLDSRSRSPLKLSFWTDLFWGAVEFIGLFFQTLFQPDLSKNGSSRSYSRFDDGRGPPRFPGPRRMGRINHGGGPSAPPMGGGG